MRADIPVSCIIDAHVHSPVMKNTKEVNEYLRKLVDSGIGGAVILGIPPFRDLLLKVSYDDILKEYDRTKYLIEKFAGEVKDFLTPENLYFMAHQISEAFCQFIKHQEISALSNFTVLFPANLSLEPDALSTILERSTREGFKGFKIISTLFFKYLNDPSVEATIEIANAKGLPVTIHGGCDPGIWELPKFCKYGDPSKLDPILKKYRDAKIIIAHAGGYSAIAPGVFMDETLELVKKYENVYIDTSALPTQLIPLIMKDFPINRIMYGSDYPAVSNSNPKEYMEDVFLTLLSNGISKSNLEKYSHENAESVFNIECISRNYNLLD
ncbi:MAG: metal-dependent hydrolase [Caldisphaera sp.]|nr:MAG: metal-dependent hydrolase [Caldisphaera sp.]